MELVISALKRQLALEEAWRQKRDIMMENADKITRLEPLPADNPVLIRQLKSVLAKLEWNTEAIALLSEIQQLHKGDEIGDKITAKLLKFTNLI